MNEERAAVAVHQLSAGYGKRTVLRDVAFSLPAGERIALIGPNGAGKSTLLKTMLGFLKPKSGTVEIFGEPLEKVRSRIAYMPQSAEVNWNFPITVEGVAEMGLFVSLGWFRKPGKAERERVEQALEELGLTDLRKRQISELSGGQKKRVFLARALVQNADLFFLDEPLAGVDYRSERAIMEKLEALVGAGKSVVAVHHDVHTITRYFDRAVLLDGGTVQAVGEAREVVVSEAMRKCYGEVFQAEKWL